MLPVQLVLVCCWAKSCEKLLDIVVGGGAGGVGVCCGGGVWTLLFPCRLDMICKDCCALACGQGRGAGGDGGGGAW